MVRRFEENMANFSEEADTRMIHHITSLSVPSNIVLRTYDTDVLCIVLGVRKHLSNHHRIWMEVGHYSNNSLIYIGVDKIHDYLGASVCNALQGFHIFTGSDYI